MKYLLDTNVISEIKNPLCEKKVSSFIKKIPYNDIYLSVATIGELCYGIEKLPVSRKKHTLSVWLYTEIPQQFKNRIIDISYKVMLEWGKLRARTGRTLPRLDSLIAATALTNNMCLITRNTKDFKDISGLSIINPWEFKTEDDN